MRILAIQSIAGAGHRFFFHLVAGRAWSQRASGTTAFSNQAG